MRDLEAVFAGALLGVALGDAVGERAFFVARGVRDPIAVIRDEAARIKTLGYTDDTAMTLALADALAARGAVDGQHLGDVFAARWREEPWRGYASGPPLLFERAARTGIPYEALARELAGGEGSLGNGAAMRVAPVGLFFHDAGDDALYEQAARSARVTHAHPLGIDAAAVLARLVAEVVRRGPDEALAARELSETLRAFARTDALRGRLDRVRELLERGATHRAAADALGRGVTALDSVPFALFAFLRAPAPFDASVLRAVAEEGDRDTIGAMVGALAGARAGRAGLPEDWVAKVEGRSAIEVAARGLLERFRGKRAGS
jgi:poly(ADP-ribose) glycohydrolase ARH3